MRATVLALLTLTYLSLSMASVPTPGSYSLINGTGGCPESLELDKSCKSGFSLTPQINGTTMDSIDFCNINSGPKVLDSGNNQRTIVKVSKDDTRLEKKETVVMVSSAGPISLVSEDTLMADGKSDLLWEHSRNQRGYSCLYRK